MKSLLIATACAACGLMATPSTAEAGDCRGGYGGHIAVPHGDHYDIVPVRRGHSAHYGHRGGFRGYQPYGYGGGYGGYGYGGSYGYRDFGAYGRNRYRGNGISIYGRGIGIGFGF